MNYEHMTGSNVCEQFNRLKWHDSKLRSFCVSRKGDTDHVVVFLELRGISTQELAPATLILEDAAYIKAELDLEGKYQCSDDISSASCSIEGPLKQELLQSQLKYSPGALDGYYLFDLFLIPPGGRIQVFAKGFKLKHGDNKS